MRISKLRRIKLILDPVINREGYFSYIAPLNPEHYKRYIELINQRFDSPINFSDILTKEENLRAIVEQIDVRIEILVDTNLYVSKIDSNELDYGMELIELISHKRINYRFLIGEDELINELENKPEDKLNE